MNIKDRIRKKLPELAIYGLLILIVVIAVLFTIKVPKEPEKALEPTPAPQSVRLPSSQTPQPITRANFALKPEQTRLRLDSLEEDIQAHWDAQDAPQTHESDEPIETDAKEQDAPESAVLIEEPPVALAAYVNAATETSLDNMTLTYLGRIYVTGYDAFCKHCGSGTGVTASGVTAEAGRTVAMNGIKFGTELYIEGIGFRIVEDRGPMPGQNIDVACIDHAACYAITGLYKVYIVERDQP